MFIREGRLLWTLQYAAISLPNKSQTYEIKVTVHNFKSESGPLNFCDYHLPWNLFGQNSLPESHLEYAALIVQFYK